MGKPSAPSTQTVINKTELPKWVEDASSSNYQLAEELSKNIPAPYSGNVVAGFSPTQSAAFDYARNNVGGQDANMAAAIGNANAAGSYTPGTVSPGSFLSGDIGAYMNPYIQNVEQAAMGNMRSALASNLNQIGDRAIGANAFGGSRQGVAEGVAASEAARGMGELSARLRAQGYDAAGTMMGQDLSRAMQADALNQQAGLTANQQAIQSSIAAGNLASTAQGMGYKDAAALESIGSQEQGLEAQRLAQDAARYDAQRAYYLEPLNVRLSALGMSPYGSTSTQTSTRSGGTGSNPLMGALGGASMGASIFSALGGTAAMGSAGYGLPILGALLGLSDETMKTDVEKVGKDKETGLNLYAYRYKGDPKNYPKVVGPMAQEIKQKYPEQVTKVGDKLAVNLGFGPMKRAMGG